MKLDIDVHHMLESMGMDNVRRMGDEVQFSCPFPEHTNGDRNPSNSMHSGTTQWHCFGCHRSGNAVTLVCMIEGVSPMRAAAMLNEAYGDGFVDPENGVRAELENIMEEREDETISLNVPIEQTTVIDVAWDRAERSMDELPENIKYPFTRGFTSATLREYGVMYDPMSDRIALPVRDIAGNIVGFKARTPYEHVQPRYKVLGDRDDLTGYGFQPCRMSLEVFGAHMHVGSRDEIVVVEGEFDAMMLHQLGYRSVALSGSNPSEEQLRKLSMCGGSVVIFSDHDPAGIKCARKVAKYLSRSHSIRFVQDHDGDVNSLQPTVVRELIESARSQWDVLFTV